MVIQGVKTNSGQIAFWEKALIQGSGNKVELISSPNFQRKKCLYAGRSPEFSGLFIPMLGDVILTIRRDISETRFQVNFFAVEGTGFFSGHANIYVSSMLNTANIDDIPKFFSTSFQQDIEAFLDNAFNKLDDIYSAKTFYAINEVEINSRAVQNQNQNQNRN